GQEGRSAAARHELDVERHQPARELLEPGLVVHRDEGALHGCPSSRYSPASGPRSRGARNHPRPCQGNQPWPRTSAAPGLVLATQKLDGITRRGTVPVVKDRLDVVAVRIEDVGAEVAGVVLRALAGRTVVWRACREPGAVERLDRCPVRGGECEVNVLGDRLIADEREGAASGRDVE